MKVNVKVIPSEYQFLIISMKAEDLTSKILSCIKHPFRQRNNVPFYQTEY